MSDQHREEETSVRPYHHHTLLLAALVFMVASLVISGSLWWWQLTHDDTHITGALVSTSTDSLVIIDARGKTTTVNIKNANHPQDSPDPTTLSTGTPLIIRGEFSENGEFEAVGIRPLNPRP